jgi:hypothetical protein
MGESDAERAVDSRRKESWVIARSLSLLATSRRSKHKMWIAGAHSPRKKNMNGGRCRTVNKRSDVIIIGDRLVSASWRPELGLRSGLWPRSVMSWKGHGAKTPSTATI